MILLAISTKIKMSMIATTRLIAITIEVIK